MTRLSKKALRFYDQNGVLVPEAKDPFTGYRYYTGTQLEKGMKIKTLLSLGFSLEESSKLLDAESDGNYEHIEACFKEKIKETQAEIQQLQKNINILHKACENKETDADIEIALPVSGKISIEDPKMEIKTLPATKAVSAVCVGPYYEVEVAYNSVLSFVKENNLELFDLCGELYLNDTTEIPDEELLTETQIQVREK